MVRMRGRSMMAVSGGGPALLPVATDSHSASQDRTHPTYLRAFHHRRVYASKRLTDFNTFSDL
jgi:hypothetical protein